MRWLFIALWIVGTACSDDEGSSGTEASSNTSAATSGAGGSTTATSGAGGTVDCMDDPSLCPAGQGCVCGGPGPGPWPCHCGLECTSESQCTDPRQPVCCGANGQGICTDSCTCYCD